MDKLKCRGVGRDKDNAQALQFYFDRPVTDYEMRFLHGVVERASLCIPQQPEPTPLRVVK